MSVRKLSETMKGSKALSGLEKRRKELQKMPDRKKYTVRGEAKSGVFYRKEYPTLKEAKTSFGTLLRTAMKIWEGERLDGISIALYKPMKTSLEKETITFGKDGKPVEVSRSLVQLLTQVKKELGIE